MIKLRRYVMNLLDLLGGRGGGGGGAVAAVPVPVGGVGEAGVGVVLTSAGVRGIFGTD
jgi:hypothetical protein